MGTEPGPTLFDPFVSYAYVRFEDDDESRFSHVALPPSLERAVPRRRLEFLAGRHCAAIALGRLAPPAPGTVKMGAQGAPAWPPGVVGAITHGHGFAAAAVAWRKDARGVGLDSERIVSAETAGEIADQIAAPDEMGALDGAGLDAASLLTVVFSAKESVYKCLYGLVGHYFDFHDVAVERVSVDTSTFEVTLRTDLGGLTTGTRLEGRFAIADGFVHTAMVLGAPARRASMMDDMVPPGGEH